MKVILRFNANPIEIAIKHQGDNSTDAVLLGIFQELNLELHGFLITAYNKP